MKNNWDNYLDPPDEPEEEYCESCGSVMEVKRHYHTIPDDMVCPNQFCPDKHYGTAKEMAIELADTKASLDEMKKKVKHLVRLIKIYNPGFEY